MGGAAGSETGVDLLRGRGHEFTDVRLAGVASVEELVGSPRVSIHSGLAVRWHDVEGSSSDVRARHMVAKRVLDVVGATVGLVLLAPLFVLVSLAIKLTSPGPVLFRQKREGLKGEVFDALKFRSMAVTLGDASGISQTVKNDPRVTPVGRFIRRTSIDELPQLLNVLKGEMSLVGPRPHVPGMMAAGRPYRELVSYYDRRLEMLPGITGWAQVNGLRGETRNPSKARERIDHDLAYIQNFSIWLDLKILALTIAREFLTGRAD
jgi:exopolysaccharide biosynthesis polyprenyl glycosylphosphotransferase